MKQMPVSVFINHRHEDARALGAGLHDVLGLKLPGDDIFIDVQIQKGDDYAEAIDRAIAGSNAVLVLIGSDWLTLRNDKGVRRLDEPKDYVRREIRTALRCNVRIIPVLFDGATMPKGSEVPADIAGFTRFQAARLSDAHWEAGVKEIIDAIEATRPSSPPRFRSLRRALLNPFNLAVLGALVAAGFWIDRWLFAVAIAAYALLVGISLRWGAEEPQRSEGAGTRTLRRRWRPPD